MFVPNANISLGAVLRWRQPGREAGRQEAVIDDFGTTLRALRVAAGWRQQDVADRLGRAFARSTVANLEAGRQAPTPRLWATLSDALPAWRAALEGAYERECVAARVPLEHLLDPGDEPLLGGPFLLEALGYTYVFRHSRSPEEIIETRRVRARRAGADGFNLRLAHTESDQFSVEQEMLWGGSLHDAQVTRGDGATELVRRVEFERPLRDRESHEFALRSWVERDPEPSCAVSFCLTVPAVEVRISLVFHESAAPRSAWTYRGSATTGEPTEHVPPQTLSHPQWLEPGADGRVDRIWRHPAPGVEHGVAWTW